MQKVKPRIINKKDPNWYFKINNYVGKEMIYLFILFSYYLISEWRKQVFKILKNNINFK